jgi:hypothetical protein
MKAEWGTFTSALREGPMSLGRTCCFSDLACHSDSDTTEPQAGPNPSANKGGLLHAPAPAPSARVDGEHDARSAVHDVLTVLLGKQSYEALDPHQPLMASGLDSLGAVELRNALQVRGMTGDPQSTKVRDVVIDSAGVKHACSSLTL